MNEQMIELARRAVACKGWRWMPGMAYWFAGWQHRYMEESGTLGTACLPDLDDPATLGCLLALVREAHGDPHLCIWRAPERWLARCNGEWLCIDPSSEAAAFVTALEAAP